MVTDDQCFGVSCKIKEKKRIRSLVACAKFLGRLFSLMINSFSPIPNNFVRIINRLNCPPTHQFRVELLLALERIVDRYATLSVDSRIFSLGTVLIKKKSRRSKSRSLELRTNIYVQRTWNQKQTNFRFMTFSGLRKQQQNSSSFALRLRRKERDWWAASLLLRLKNGSGGFRVECSSGFRFNRDTKRFDVICVDRQAPDSLSMSLFGWNEPSLISFFRPYHFDFAWFKRKKAIKFIAFISRANH